MTDFKATCDVQQIDRFLKNEMELAESKEFEYHLDHCERCRQQITSSAAEDSLWEEAQKHLGEPESPADTPNDLAETLSFLNPSEDPRMLGRFGGYEIAGVIGQGGMGVVLKGFDQSLNRYAAIKVLAPQLATRASARDRFAREAQAAAAVVHDNVVAIYGVSEAAGLPYLVMPYLRGESLQKRLDREGSMSVLEIVRITYQIASGLAAAHAQGLIHRDIKPANILLPEGVQRVLITDFGLARAVDDSNLTGTGAIAGTPQFMSPEQARGEALDARSDLFSLGTVLYAMCTGRNPFRAANSFGILRRIIEDQPRPIREINAAIPKWLETVVSRLHAKSPNDRYPSAAGLAILLEQCLAHLQNPSAPLPAQLRARPSIARRSRWSVGLAFFGFVVLSGAWLVTTQWFGKQTTPSESGEGLTKTSEHASPETGSQELGESSARLTPDLVAHFDSEPQTDFTPLSLLRGRWQVTYGKSDGEIIPMNVLFADKRKSDGASSDSDNQGDSSDWPFPLGDMEFRDGQVFVTDRRDSHRLLVRKVEITPADSAHQMMWSDPNTGNTTHTMQCGFSVEFGLATTLVINIPWNAEASPNDSPAGFEIGLKRWETDPLYLRNEANHTKSMIKSYYDQKNEELYPFCEHLFALAESQLKEADLRERFQTLSREFDQRWKERNTESSEVAKQAITQLFFLAQKERAKRSELTRSRQDKIRRQEQLVRLTDQITALQKEGNLAGVEDVKVAVLSLLKAEDKDYDRLHDLRQRMIDLHLQGQYDMAELVDEQIARLEDRLKKRYAEVDRHSETSGYWEAALRMHHLAKQWREEGRLDAADKALLEIEILRDKIIEQFGEVAWLEFEAENLEPINKAGVTEESATAKNKTDSPKKQE